jgi:acylphosphatase
MPAAKPVAADFPPGAGAFVADWHEVNRRRMQILYSGSVQGVGFRYTVKSVATGFEITGTVRNLPDGRVELVAEGAPDELEAFRQTIRESGLEHFIRQEEVKWAESQNEFRGFEIVR